MLARTLVLATGTLVLATAALAQRTPDTEAQAAPATTTQTAPDDSGPRSVTAVPDPLTPPEVQGPPPAAPQTSPVPAAAKTAAAIDGPVLEEIRRRLAGAIRLPQSDPADRAAVAAFYGSEGTVVAWTDGDGFTPRAIAALDELRRADDWGLKTDAFELPLLAPGKPSTDARAEAEIKLALALLKYARHARGGRINPGSISQLNDRRVRTFEPRSLIESVSKASAPDSYLRDLHPRHAGFHNLQKSLVALRRGPAEAQPADVAPATSARARAPAPRNDMAQRIIANMERWRWMPDDLGRFHVWNNIPEQITTTVKEGKVVFTERIIVGKPQTPTPNFTANMQFVIFQPEWGVPNGIKNNEIGPLLRRASADSGGWFSESQRTPASVLARHGLRVSAGNQIIDPNKIDWRTADVNRFNFIQPSGATNVLGVVKFRFPNKHDVYMHDTPTKGLFNTPLRAYSHGCMRVQNPVRFAEVLLQHDKGYSAEQVRAMVPRGTHVALSTEIPVHSVYFTVMADETGKLKTAGDLYGQDSRIASALEGRNVAVASLRSEPSAGGEVAARVKGQRAAAPQRQASVPRRSGGESNPFSGLFGN